MSENGKKVPLIIRDFQTKRAMWYTLSFFKRGDFKVSCLILRMVGLLGEKFFSFQFPWDNQNSNNFDFFVYIHVVLLINFPEQSELYFYFKYSKSYDVL